MEANLGEDKKIHVVIETDSNGSNKVHIHDDDDDDDDDDDVSSSHHVEHKDQDDSHESILDGIVSIEINTGVGDDDASVRDSDELLREGGDQIKPVTTPPAAVPWLNPSTDEPPNPLRPLRALLP